MTPSDSTETAVTRRDVLKNVGVAGVATTALAQAGAGLTPDCTVDWDAGTCVVTTREAPVVETCDGEPIATLPAGTEATVADWTCCSGSTVYYYLRWCDDEIPIGWVPGPVLDRSRGCCTDCRFRWDEGDCVATDVEGTLLFEEPCTDDPVRELPRDRKAVVLDRYCCRETGTEFHYLEWCEPDIPAFWVRQADLRPAEGCCDPCRFRWAEGDCVATDVEGTLLYEEPCSRDPVSELPRGWRAVVRDSYCCAESGTAFYYLEWCDPEIPAFWVRQAALRQAEGCC